MKRTYLFVFIGMCFLIFASMIFRPVSIPEDPSELLVAEGQVVKIFEGGTHDIAFRLKGDKTMYYINRGMEYGLNLEELQNELTGNNVTIKYPEHWTLLDPKNRVKHLCILEYNGKELFNEIKLVHSNEIK